MKIHFITVAMYQLFATNVLPTQVHSLIFSHSGATLLMSTATGQVLLYEYPTLLPAHSVDAHASAALCLELDPRGAHLAVGGSDAVMSIWDTSEWICMRTLRGMDAPVRSVSFSFDGAYICAGTEQSDEAGSHDIEIVSFGRHIL
jgi:THO complex subunit 3